MFKFEVIADSSGTWCSNARTFETHEEAEEAARDLASRWMAVSDWRVVVTYEGGNWRVVEVASV